MDIEILYALGLCLGIPFIIAIVFGTIGRLVSSAMTPDNPTTRTTSSESQDARTHSSQSTATQNGPKDSRQYRDIKVEEEAKRMRDREFEQKCANDAEQIRRQQRAAENARRKDEEDRQRRQDEFKRRNDLQNEAKQYMAILGLYEPFTPAEIKKQYRLLVTQYHPDKVNHLGPKLKEMADIEMKKINAAYNYFRASMKF